MRGRRHSRLDDLRSLDSEVVEGHNRPDLAEEHRWVEGDRHQARSTQPHRVDCTRLDWVKQDVQKPRTAGERNHMLVVALRDPKHRYAHCLPSKSWWNRTPAAGNRGIRSRPRTLHSGGRHCWSNELT